MERKRRRQEGIMGGEKRTGIAKEGKPKPVAGRTARSVSTRCREEVKARRELKIKVTETVQVHAYPTVGGLVGWRTKKSRRDSRCKAFGWAPEAAKTD
jgi:hypothetical protein